MVRAERAVVVVVEAVPVEVMRVVVVVEVERLVVVKVLERLWQLA